MAEGRCFATIEKAQAAMRAVRTLDDARQFERDALKTTAGRHVQASPEWTHNPLASTYGQKSDVIGVSW